MPFDLSTAKPVSGFDLSTAKPVTSPVDDWTKTLSPQEQAEMSKMTPEQRRELFTYNGPEAKAYKAQHSGVVAGVKDFGRGIGGIADAGMSMATGLGATAAAGLTASTDSVAGATDYIQDVVDRNTYRPRTEVGQALLKMIGSAMAPYEKGKEFLGDKTLEATGSPLLATGAHMLPDVLSALVPAARAGEGSVLKAGEELPINILAEETGQTTARLGDNAKTAFDAQESGPYLQIKRSDVDPALRGQGHGTRIMKELVDHAENRGLTLGSDVSVSPSASGMYAKLKKEGYEVTQNPSNINPETGNLVSLDPKKPVFEVRKTPAEQKSPEQVKQDAIDLLLKNDVPLRTSERGDSPLQQTAGKLGRAGDTFAGGPSGKQATQNQAFTAAVFKKAGEDVKNVTPESMAELHQKVQNLYNQAHALPIELDSELVSGLSELAAKASRSPDAGVSTGLERLVENVAKNSEVANGKPVLPAEYVSQLRSELGSSWLSASGGGAKDIGGEFMQLLDDAVERKAPPEQAAAAKAARLKFHQMKQIQDSLVLTDKGMIVSPNKLVNTLSRKRNANEYFYGKGDNQELVALAKAGKQILGDKVGNSGTATRGIDVGTIAELAIEPRKGVGRVLNASASILSGRMLNELRMARGTTADLAKKAAEAKNKAPPNWLTTGKTSRGAVITTSEEQKRKRQAEALRR